jgi:hypothetical protein
MALAITFAGIPGVSAAKIDSIRSAAMDSAIEQVQYGGRNYYCERLRRACEFKHERGEEGEGNCRRYREECGRPQYDCRELRQACEFRHERGEEGEGNCRRYRELCVRSY